MVTNNPKPSQIDYSYSPKEKKPNFSNQSIQPVGSKSPSKMMTQTQTERTSELNGDSDQNAHTPKEPNMNDHNKFDSSQIEPITLKTATAIPQETIPPKMNILLRHQKIQIQTLQSNIDALNVQLETSSSKCKDFISNFQSKLFNSLTTKLYKKLTATASILFHLNDVLPILDSINIQPPSHV
mmetsp:Transcript_42150/g.51340  ORF Transcript_42150/g.51340 Transcript_42150/m.51340 type:complete len:183 (-) Transcript_42150:260-808(-)